MRRAASMLCTGMFLLLTTAGASANQASDGGSNDASRSARNAVLEGDLQVSALLTGGRIKGTVYSGQNFSYGVEALAGYGLGLSIGGDDIYGLGLRAEHLFSSTGRHSWAVAPGVDLYYAPAKHHCDPQSPNLVSSTFCDLSTVETRVNLLSPTVDLSWIYQFSPRFGLTMGLRGGADIFINGQRVDGSHLAGSTAPELAYFIGFRF